MRRLSALSLCALLMVSSGPPAAAAETAWTLETAVQTALERSPDAGMARERVAAAEALAQQAQASLFPQLSLQAGYRVTNTPMLAFGAILNQGAFRPDLDFNRPGTVDALTAAGTGSYTLYDGGRSGAARLAARAHRRAAEHERTAAHHQLAAEVVKAVVNVQKAREAVLAVEAATRAYAAAVQVAARRFDAGQVLKTDLLSLQVQAAETTDALLRARHAAALSEHAFRSTVGLEPGADAAPLAFIGVDESLAQVTLPAETDPASRPELQALQQRVDAAAAALTAARAERRPAVKGFATYQYDKGYRLDRDGDSWAAGVALDLTLFDGGRTRATVAERQADLALAQEQLRRTRLMIALQVEQARLAHVEARERILLAEQVVAQAEESAALSRARFEREGLLSADLIGAESRLLDARLRLTVATADERLALIDLRRALGLPPLFLPSP